MTAARQSETAQGGGLALSIWSIVAAFGTYFCMYGFRKPFTAAAYNGDRLGQLDFKTVLVSAQVLGYALSKYLGIRFISAMQPARRALWLVVLIGTAHLALLLFAVVPRPWNSLCLFLNGVPLGMVFGLVLGFLEGRQRSEALTAGLCASFVVADGVTKSVGTFLLHRGVSEAWMPVTAGLLFSPPLLFFIWMLTRIPAPSAADVAERHERTPMTAEDRWHFFRRHVVGIVLLLAIYLLMTVLRSLRADFAPEIWKGLGVVAQAGLFTRSELLVAITVLILTGSVAVLRDNRQAFFAALGLSMAGLLLVGLALLGWRAGELSAFAFMVLLGLGLYLPYIAFHTSLFERLLAMTRARGNVGYLMYLADTVGYLGYVGIMVAQNVLGGPAGHLEFLATVSAVSVVVCLVLALGCWWYFARQA